MLTMVPTQSGHSVTGTHPQFHKRLSQLFGASMGVAPTGTRHGALGAARDHFGITVILVCMFN